jgi:NTP pyrophosphatase (non-canonical NTP hydrolase)
MTFKEYQRLCKKTAVYPKEWPEGFYYTIMGLAGEAGELSNKVKKHIRDDTLNVHDLLDELGDVLWYCAAIATELGADLGHVAENNIDKLLDRLHRGVVKGEGDRR